jgi:hypothetical protein
VIDDAIRFVSQYQQQQSKEKIQGEQEEKLGEITTNQVF